jgi:hypothetical protein
VIGDTRDMQGVVYRSSTLLLFFLTLPLLLFRRNDICYINFVATSEGEHKSPNGRQADKNNWSRDVHTLEIGRRNDGRTVRILATSRSSG